MTQGLLSKGTTLSYKLASVMTVLPNLLGIPDLGGSVDKVEVTTLADSTRRYIKGLVDYGDLTFRFLYGNAANDSFRILTGLEAADTVQDWEIELPDGTVFAFSGFPTVIVDGFEGANAVTFTLSITINSEIIVTNPTT